MAERALAFFYGITVLKGFLLGAGATASFLSLVFFFDHPEVQTNARGWVTFIILPGIIGPLMILAAIYW
jgi:hypothetical protein